MQNKSASLTILATCCILALSLALGMHLRGQSGTSGFPSPPPAASIRPVTDDYYGTKITDPYRYMENFKDPQVQAWMKAQDDYTRAMLAGIPGRTGCSPISGPCCFRYSGSSSTVIPSTPGLPLLALTRCSACLQFSSSQTSSISRSVPARLSACRFAMSVSVPSSPAFGASLLLSVGKASSPCSGWFFCRCPLMSRAAYLPFPLFPLRGTVRAFVHRSRLGLSCFSAFRPWSASLASPTA